MFVLGIDPGLSRCGFGAVRRLKGKSVAVEHGVLSTPPDDELPARLGSLNAQMRSLLDRLAPDVVVVERVFFQTNVRTAMGVAQASGLALAMAFERGCDVVQYTSNEVKLAIAGYGGADKAQMQRMVQRILNLESLPKPADAADALALALHHLAIAPFASRVAKGTLEGSLRLPGPTATSPFGNARIATKLGGVRIANNSAGAKSQTTSGNRSNNERVPS